MCGEHLPPLIHGKSRMRKRACTDLFGEAISDGRPYRDSYFLVNGHIWSMEGTFRLASSPEYRLCGRSLWTAMPSAFFCPIRTSSRLPRVMPCKKPVICSLEGGHIRAGYLTKGGMRLGSYSKSTRPSR